MAAAAPVISAVGGIAGAVQGASGGGGGGMPRWMRRAQRANYDMAQNVPMGVAGFTRDERAAHRGVRGLQGYLESDARGATRTARELSQGIGADDIRKFYNPYEQDVVNSFLGDLDVMKGQNNLIANDLAEKSSAFGGDRDAVYRAVSGGELDRTAASSIGALRHAGYSTAGQLALGNHGLRLAGNDQLRQMIESRRGFRGDSLRMLASSGADQRALNQARMNLPQDRLRLMMEAANQQFDPNGRQNYDSVGGALAGYQGGYQTMQDILDLIRNRGAPPAGP